MGLYMYHLTSVENFKSILDTGYIYCRNKLKQPYQDTASEDIIAKRGIWNDYVPFHVTMNTPYTHAVRNNNKDKGMINLAFYVTDFYAETNYFTLGHPVSSKGISFTLENYDNKKDDIDTDKGEILVKYRVLISQLKAVYIGEQNKTFLSKIEALLQQKGMEKVHVNI